MNKKIVISLIAAILVVTIGVGVFFALRNNNDQDKNSGSANGDSSVEDGNSTSSNANNGGNMLVVYFSAQGHTEEVANQIASNLGADIFEITPVDAYTSDDLDWTDDNSRVSREHNDESLQNVELTTTEVPNWDSYDTVLLGYPIWWGDAAWPVNTFVENNNFDGKTVIPFCTSASSSIGQSDTRLAELAGTGNWQSGHRFSSNASTDEIKQFTDSL